MYLVDHAPLVVSVPHHSYGQGGGVGDEVGKPPAGQESKWEEIYGEFSSSQVEILAPKFDLQSDGKVPEPVCRKVDTWLRRAMKSSPRAVLALSYPNEAEIKMQNRYKQRSMKLR